MLPLKSKKPRRIRRGQLPTGNPQSKGFGQPALSGDQSTWAIISIYCEKSNLFLATIPKDFDGRVHVIGVRRWARWYISPKPDKES